MNIRDELEVRASKNVFSTRFDLVLFMVENLRVPDRLHLIRSHAERHLGEVAPSGTAVEEGFPGRPSFGRDPIGNIAPSHDFRKRVPV